MKIIAQATNKQNGGGDREVNRWIDERKEKRRIPHTMLRARAAAINTRRNCMAVLPDVEKHWVCSKVKTVKMIANSTSSCSQQHLRFRVSDGKI